MTQAQLIAGRSALADNPGRAFGRLRLVEDIKQVDDLAPEDIVVLRKAPLALPPVAGVSWPRSPRRSRTPSTARAAW